MPRRPLTATTGWAVSATSTTRDSDGSSRRRDSSMRPTEKTSNGPQKSMTSRSARSLPGRDEPFLRGRSTAWQNPIILGGGRGSLKFKKKKSDPLTGRADATRTWVGVQSPGTRSAVLRVPTVCAVSDKRSWPTWLALSASLIVVPLALLPFGSASRNQQPTGASLTGLSRPRFSLEVSPELVDLGAHRAGEPARAWLRLRNEHDRTVVLETVKADCPCIRAQPVPIRIPPGGVARLLLSLDSDSEPGFTGKLLVPVAGYQANGEIAFRVQVAAELGNSSGR
jgi:hypothetical protein